MIFDLKKSEIYKAVSLYRIFPAGILKFYRILLFILGAIPIGFWVINKAFPTQINMGLGWSIIVLPFALSGFFFAIFAPKPIGF